MYTHRFLLFLLAILLIGAACADSDDESEASGLEEEKDASAALSDGGAQTPESRFIEAALEELEEANVFDLVGKAVVKSVEEREDATKVTFDPDSGPICLRGADFWMFYKDRGSDKTMIVLDGGGACWTGFCMASETADEQPLGRGPASADPDNYFGDWNMVFVPYCDGSVFSGANEVTEPDGTIRYHHGRQNLAASLDQAMEHFGDSTQVMVAGFSAGGYGTIPGMVAARITFPDADLFVMSDSGPGLQNPANADATAIRIEEWGFDETIPAGCVKCEGGHGQLSQMFLWMLDNDKTVKISVLSYFGDGVIGGYFNQMTQEEYKELLLTETDPIHDKYPDRFNRFMLPGTQHVVTLGWNTLTADGVKVSDWVTAMVTGDDTVWKDIIASGP
jgi:hypothetical protein